MITPASRAVKYRLYGSYTTNPGTWAILIDRFGTAMYFDTFTNAGTYVEYSVPAAALTSAQLPGTLYLQVNNVTIKSFPIDISAVARAAEVAATTFGDTFSTYSTTPSTATVQITQGTYPNWDTINNAVLWSTQTNIDYNGIPIQFPTDATQALIANSGVGTDLLYKPIDMEWMHSGTTYFGLLVPAMGYVPDKIHIWVDDLEVSGSPFTLTSVALNTVTITLPDTSSHKIRAAGHLMHSYFIRNNGGSISAVSAKKCFGVIGDSYMEGLSYNYHDAIPIWLRSYTGWKVWNMAQQGTGFMNPYINAASVFGSSTRLAQIKAAPIDALIVNGSINDQQNYSVAATTAAQLAFYNAVRAMKPDLPIIQILPEDSPWFVTNVGDPTTLNNAMRAVAEAHKSVVGVINPIQENWIYGTGNTGATNGTGNADTFITTDGVHPSPAGCKYMAGLMAVRISRMLMQNGN